MSNIVVSNKIAFLEDEILFEGHGSTNALYIMISCKVYTLPKALLDNGSSINVIPMETLSRLPVDLFHM